MPGTAPPSRSRSVFTCCACYALARRANVASSNARATAKPLQLPVPVSDLRVSRIPIANPSFTLQAKAPLLRRLKMTKPPPELLLSGLFCSRSPAVSVGRDKPKPGLRQAGFSRCTRTLACLKAHAAPNCFACELPICPTSGPKKVRPLELRLPVIFRWVGRAGALRWRVHPQPLSGRILDRWQPQPIKRHLDFSRITEELRLSEHTVRNYLFHAFEKLGVSSRIEFSFT